jgi:glutathione S-transferase
LQEKGYGEDEVDLRVVDLAKGENFASSFLRLNPKATVPTLVVPLQKTLSQDVESRYKALTETRAVVDFLDRSRSVLSRTHTTSSAPAPALAAATISLSETSTKIIDIVHSEDCSPNTLAHLNARDLDSLRTLAKDMLPLFTARQTTLAGYISAAECESIHVSDKTKNFWQEKKTATEILLDVYLNAEKGDNELDGEDKKKRDEYLAKATAAWEALKKGLNTLSQELIGPYALGDQVSIADIHLTAWLIRLVKLAGGSSADEGNRAIGLLESHLGGGFRLPKDYEPQRADGDESKLAAFWDVMKARGSWSKVYGDGHCT